MSIGDAVGGALVSGVSSLTGGMLTNDAAADNASNQMDFQERMSSTAHTREVADLKAAGLNPILSANSSGSSTPSGVSAPVINALGNAAEAAISNFSALQGSRQAEAQMDALKTQSNLNSALTAKAAADTTTALANARNVDADTANKVADLPTHQGAAAIGQVGSAVERAALPFVNSAVDATHSIYDKLDDVISSIRVNSGKALDAASSWYHKTFGPSPVVHKDYSHPKDSSGISISGNAPPVQ